MVSKKKLGTAVRKHKDWFDENSMELEELIDNRTLTKNNMLSKNSKSTKAWYGTCQLLWQRCREHKNKVADRSGWTPDTCRPKWPQRFLPKHRNCIGAKRESPRTTASSRQPNNKRNTWFLPRERVTFSYCLINRQQLSNMRLTTCPYLDEVSKVI